MRSIILAAIVIVTSQASSAQEPDVKPVNLSIDKMAGQVIKREFPEAPKKVKEFHAHGTYLLKVWVGADGKATRITPITKFGPEAVNEYLIQAVANWKFKPVMSNGKSVPYVGTVRIPFWYGVFDRTGWQR